MVRRSFRLGLRLGLLFGVIFALVKLMQARRPIDDAGSAWTPGSWTPPTPAPRASVVPPAKEPTAPPTVELEVETIAPAAAAVEPAAEPSVAPAAPAASAKKPPAAKKAPAAKQTTPAKPVTKAGTAKKPPAAAAAAAAAAKKAPAAKKAAWTAAAWVEPEEDRCPASHPVKVKLASRIFHLPGMLAYERTRADRCYENADSAIADGFTRAKR